MIRKKTTMKEPEEETFNMWLLCLLGLLVFCILRALR